MTTTKITLETTCGLLGVFLHPPGSADPLPLPGVEHTCTLKLQTGVYAISVAGSGNVPGTKVSLKIETLLGAVSRSRSVRDDGTIAAWLTFELSSAGEVS